MRPPFKLLSATIWLDLTALALLLAPITAAAQFGPGAPSVLAGRPLATVPVTPVTSGQTVYLSCVGGDLSATQLDVQTRIAGGTLAHAQGFVTVAPGSGQSVTFTLQTGACGSALADSAVTFAIADTARDDEDLTHRVTVSDGGCCAWKVAYSASAASSRPRVGINFF